jgi:hypothetical protein
VYFQPFNASTFLPTAANVHITVSEG